MLNPNSLCPGCMGEKVSNGKCPICGYNPAELQNPQHLAANSLLEGRYVIGKPLDSNGESVTYLGFDTATNTIVNIREYFPQGLCARDADNTVVMKSGSEFNYNEGLMQFINLSKELFKLNELPALFDVLDVREANNTAYRITRAVPGISLREFLLRNGGILKWDQARSLFAPLISSISALHKAGIIHRGISPDTLIVGKDGKLRLNGFCIESTRTAKSEFTSQLFPGFAAVEQYGVAGTQGTWTDVYAFAATIYRTLVGNPPPEATERLISDNMTIPAKIARETPTAVLETLANALQILPDDRTQHIDDMRKGLSVSSAQQAAAAGVVSGGAAGNAAAKAATGTSSAAATVNVKNEDTNKKTAKKKSTKIYGLVAFIATAVLLAVIIIIVLWTMGIFGNDDSSSTAPSNSLPTQSTENLVSASSIATDQNFDMMPDFSDKTYAELVTDSKYYNIVKFKIVSKEYSDDVEPGRVISQSPAEGTTFEVGKTTVELVISAGPYYINLPDFRGMEKDAVFTELRILGFRAENIVFEEVNVLGVAPGCVVETLPGVNAEVNTETKIYVKVNMLDSGVSSPDDTTSSTPTPVE